MRAQLVPLNGSPAIVLDKELTVVGRKEGCDISLDHKSVSKVHCVLVKTDGLLLLRDLGSTNGTRVNGMRVRRAALLPNDQLTIAGFAFRVVLGPSDPDSRPSEATQRIDSATLRRLPRPEAEAPPLPLDSQEEASNVPLKVNSLPDLYEGSSDSGGG